MENAAEVPHQRNITPMVKRYARLGSRSTTVCLEAPFWEALDMIADERSILTTELLVELYSTHTSLNFCSDLRLHALNYYVERAAKHKQKATTP